MATRAQWIAATRPRTLPAAVAPVLVGIALAAEADAFDPGLSVLAVIVALALQVGVNFANDYSDGIRGTDDVRVGPTRLVGQGLAAASTVKRAAFLAFGVAALAGLGVVVITGAWILLAVGALAIVSAWFYTGGTRPYGYAGLGEVFVFVWFGLVAVNGTVYIQTGSIPDWRAWTLGAGAGALSCALLVANNLRDVPTDAVVGKRTLAVRLGEQNTRLLFVGLLFAGMASPIVVVLLTRSAQPIDAILLVPFLVAHVPGRAVLGGASGRELLPVLAASGRLLLVWSLCVSAVLTLAAV